MEEQRFGKQVFAVPIRDNGTQKGIPSPGPAEHPPVYHTSPIVFAVTWSDSSFLRPGPLPKFFWAMTGEIKNSSSVF